MKKPAGLVPSWVQIPPPAFSETKKTNEKRGRHVKTKASDVRLPLSNEMDVPIEFQTCRRCYSEWINLARR